MPLILSQTRWTGAAALLKITRPFNLAILLAALLFARHLAGGEGDGIDAACSIAAALLLVAGFYVWNDIDDDAVDRLNAPNRPLPSRALSARAARLWRVVLLAAAFVSAAAAGLFPAAVIALWFLLLFMYEMRFKRCGYAANLLVSAIAASALLFGAYLGGDTAAGLYPALFALFLHMGREILKDIGDIEGDSAGGRRTLPIEMGRAGALRVVALLLAGLALLTPVPFLSGRYNLLYLVLAVAGVGVPALLGAGLSLVRPERVDTALFSLVLKGEMVFIMAAMLLGSVS